MGLLSKIFGGIKKVIRKIGGGIKRLAKKIGGVFGKLGILGHIGMMFLMPYLPGWWGNLGSWATKLTQGTSMAGKAFGHVMRGVYHAGKAVGTVYRGVTEAISGSMKWLGNKADLLFGGDGLRFGANPWEGLKSWKDSVTDWGKEGWSGAPKAEWKPEPSVGSSESKYSTGETTLRDQMKETMRQQGVEPMDDFSLDPLGGDQGLGEYRIQKVGGIQPAEIGRFQGAPEFANLDDIKSFMMKSEQAGISFSTGEMNYLQDSYTKLAQSGGTAIKGELAKKNLMDRASDFVGDVGDRIKQNLSAEGLADAATEGATGGIKQAVGAKVAEAVGYDQPDYISKSVSVPMIQTFQGDILDDAQLTQFSQAGWNAGSHQMNQYYGQVMNGFDDYMLLLNQNYPAENTTQYKAQPAFAGSTA
jgi:hypothetical protein